MRYRSIIRCAVFALALGFGGGGFAAPVVIFCQLAAVAGARSGALQNPSSRQERKELKAWKRVEKVANKPALTHIRVLKLERSLAKLRARKFTRSAAPKRGGNRFVLDPEAIDAWYDGDLAVIEQCGVELDELAKRIDDLPESKTKTKCEELRTELGGGLLVMGELALFGEYEEYADIASAVARIWRKLERCVARGERARGNGKPPTNEFLCKGTVRGNASVKLGNDEEIVFPEGGGNVEIPGGAEQVVLGSAVGPSGQNVQLIFTLVQPTKTGKVTLGAGQFSILINLATDEGVLSLEARPATPTIELNVISVDSCESTRAYQFELSNVPIDIFEKSSPFVPIENTRLDLFAQFEMALPIV